LNDRRNLRVAAIGLALLVTAAVTPLAQSEEIVVIAAAGDVACPTTHVAYNDGQGTATECAQTRVSDLLVGRGLAKVLPLGDLQYESGALAQFQASYDPSWGRVKDITAPAPGNHEHKTAGAQGYYDYFNGEGNADGPAGERGKGYYSYDVGAWHLIALNSNCGPAGVTGGCTGKSPMITWLKADLAAHPNLCTLAYWHHPRFSSESPSQMPMKQAWLALYAKNADLILNGHKHHYERLAPQTPLGVADPARGIREIIVGTGGKGTGDMPPASFLSTSEAWNADTFGVLEVSLLPDSYAWEFRPEAAGGSFTDSGVTACH